MNLSPQATSLLLVILTVMVALLLIDAIEPEFLN
jgi:hypothetical protein